MRRLESDQEIVDRGKLWIEFKNTEWFKDLSFFLNSQLDFLKDSVVSLTLNHQYEEAKVVAQKMAGFREVKDFIENDAIEAMNQLIAGEQADHEYKEAIHTHV